MWVSNFTAAFVAKLFRKKGESILNTYENRTKYIFFHTNINYMVISYDQNPSPCILVLLNLGNGSADVDKSFYVCSLMVCDGLSYNYLAGQDHVR